MQLNRWVVGIFLQRGQRYWVSSTLCRYEIRMGLLLVLCWATCFSRERELRMGDLRGELVYEFVMVALQKVCLYYAGVYPC